MAKAKTARVRHPGVDPQTLEDLVADPHNRRTHPPRNLAMLTEALKDVGTARSIVIDEDDTIMAGNGVVTAALGAGLTKLQVVDVEGDTLVAVRRRGLTAEQKRALAIYDNRTAELAEWNVPQLEADLANVADLTPFFTDAELDKLLKRRAPPDVSGAASTTVPGQYLVVITCTDEAEQVRLLERFAGEGLACKALVS